MFFLRLMRDKKGLYVILPQTILQHTNLQHITIKLRKQEKRRKQLEILMKKVRIETKELIKTSTGSQIRCPDCKLSCHRHRGGGFEFVDYRMNYCKLRKFKQVKGFTKCWAQVYFELFVYF